MNSQTYFNYIEEKIDLLAVRITARSRLNILDLNIHSEGFYAQLLNIVYDWNLFNDNEFQQNVEAIDLIDHTNRYVVQVSSTSTRQKIESSLDKDSILQHKNNGYRFKFISISRDADNLKKIDNFKNPHSITFEPEKDIIDKNSILKKVVGLNPDKLNALYVFIEKNFEVIPSKTDVSEVFSIPLNINERDMKEIIDQFKQQFRLNPLERFALDSESETFEHVDKEKRKNKLNNLSQSYYENNIKRRSLQSFTKIDAFLKDPINEELAYSYENIAAEIANKIEVDIDRFENFQKVFVYLYDYIIERSPTIKKHLVWVFLHHMYFNCDIGKLA